MPPVRTVARFAAVAVSILPAVAAAAPAPVAPGSPERLSPVTNGCPTFSWTAEPAAAGYEIAVYPVVESAGGTSETPVLHQRLPAGAASWTPAADRCLQPGSYGWSVRAELGRGAGPWSEASLFRVPGSSHGAGAEALDALAAALETDLDRDELARALRALASRTETNERPRRATAPVAPVPGEPPALLADRRAAAGAGSPGIRPKVGENPLLQVAGDVVSGGDFVYDQPRTVILEVPAFAFRVRDGEEDDAWELSDGGFGYVSSIPDSVASVGLLAPVRLPQNATVTVFTCDYMDDNAASGTDLRVEFRLRRRLTGSATAEVMAQVSETSAGGSASIGGPHTIDVTGAVVDNNFYTYWVEGTWDQDVVGQSLRFYGCTLIFKVPGLVP